MSRTFGRAQNNASCPSSPKKARDDDDDYILVAPSSPPAVIRHAPGGRRKRSNSCGSVTSSRSIGPDIHSILSPKPHYHHLKHHPQLWFDSPRLFLDDSQLFPTQTQSTARLQQPEDRWKYLSQQAGSHGQDGSVLHVTRPNMTPLALKAGTPPEAAKRVTELHLHFLTNNHTQQRQEKASANSNSAANVTTSLLPEWLDVVASTFFNLEHLYLAGITKENDNDENEADGREQCSWHIDNLSTSSRLRRLYVLYRLPNLRSIDGIPVTPAERKLARPSDPKGQRVKREDWITETFSLVDRLGDEEGEEEPECMDDADSSCCSQVIQSQPRAPPPLQARPRPLPHHPSSAFAKSLVEVDITGRVQLVNLTMSADEKIMEASATTAKPMEAMALPYEQMAEEKKDDEFVHPPKSTATTTPKRPPKKSSRTPVLEMESPSSAGACEWSATCGSLSLPYFRESAVSRGPFSGSSRLKLSLRRGKFDAPVVGDEKGPSQGDDDCKGVQQQSRRVETFRPIQVTKQPNAHEKGFELQAKNNDIILSYVSTPPRGEEEGEDSAQQATSKVVGPPEAIGKAPMPPGVRSSSTQTQNPRIPPRRSLTSPFPIQFRVRNDDKSKRQTDEKVLPEYAEKFRRRATLSPPTTPSLKPNLGNMQTIETIIPLARVKSSPTQLTVSNPSKLDRPPPRPPGARRLIPKPLTTPRNRRGFPKWRKQSARSTSILDTSADDSEEDDEDDDKNDDSEALSDEEEMLMA